MHIAAALDLQFVRSRRSGLQNAGVGTLPTNRNRSCCPCRLACTGLSNDVCGSKFHAWCVAGFLVACSVIFIGLFESARLTIHILVSPCTVLGSEVIDVGSCSLCDTAAENPICEVHPIATARLAVTFKPVHAEENITGWVWYCKGLAEVDPCQRQMKFLNQLRPQASAAGPIPCTVGEVYAFMQQHAVEGEERKCYYSSRDISGHDVWLTMPSPGLVDHVWFQKHLEYPVMLALGGLVLLSVLLACLALEGAELWASGLI